jgi:Putative tail fiber protein gp53-like, C-terminal
VKRLALIIFAAILSPIGWTQSIPISGQVISQYGQPVAGAQVYICSAAGSSGLPCSPVASVYYDYNLQNIAPNPVPTDNNGNFNVYVGVLPFPNIYVANMIANPGGTPYTQLYPGPSCPLSGCTFSGPVTATLFNATQSPYYEINGTQISSSALSDASNLAKLNASNTFTGTTQTAPVWNATSGFTVNGTALASTNLSDSANLARLNASNTFTGATNSFNAIAGTTINASSGFQVGGVALSASNLSNGVSGSGAICLASGSACSSSGTVSSVGVSSSTPTQLSVSGSPITSSGTITLGLNLTGTEAKLVTASTAGTATHCVNWDSLGGIGDSGSACATTPAFTGTSGYQTLGSGLIIEWGTTGSFDTGPVTVTFPLTFPHACLFAQTGQYQDSGTQAQETLIVPTSGSICTTVTMTMRNNGRTNQTWMAIGY